MVVALIALPQAQALAQSAPPDDPPAGIIYQLSFAQDRKIPELKSSEIIGDPDFQDYANNKQQLLAAPPFQDIIRDLPQFWRLRVPIEQISSVNAKYQLTAQNGKVNPFNNIQLIPLPITEISRDQKNAVVQGGVRMQFGNLSKTGNAGSYNGRLSVCVEYQGSTCP
jgi:hypothetical protein